MIRYKKYKEIENSQFNQLFLIPLRQKCKDNNLKMRVIGRHSNRKRLYEELGKRYIPGGCNNVPLAFAERLAIYIEDKESVNIDDWEDVLR